jgi:putative transposase
MRQIHQLARQTYGSPRMQDELKDQGCICGRNRVARLMRQAGLISKVTVRYRSLTKAGKREPAAENILNRQFVVAEPNRVWAADITYVPTAEGHLYLAVILDLHSRRVVGWAMASRLGSELVSSALRQAVQRRATISPGIIHHSDRDGLYACNAYKQILADNQMIRSMSRKGNCWDNACVESFFSSLKNELVAFERFRSREEAQLKIFEWIEVFYNRFRKHSTLGYLSPVDFEKQKC